MRKARFYIPFLRGFSLKCGGIICTWSLVDRSSFTAPDYFFVDRVACKPSNFIMVHTRMDGPPLKYSLIEADIPDERHYVIKFLQSKEVFAFVWVSSENSESKPDYLRLPTHPIGRTILKYLNKNRRKWAPCEPRFVRWNPSYVCIERSSAEEITIELFEYQAVYSYWISDVVTCNPKAKYEVISYENLLSAKEFFRLVSLFINSCNTKRNSGILIPQYFYLSTVYTEPFLSELMNRYICLKDTSFLHESFRLWGRFTKDDPKEIWGPFSHQTYRKIRM